MLLSLTGASLLPFLGVSDLGRLTSLSGSFLDLTNGLIEWEAEYHLYTIGSTWQEDIGLLYAYLWTLHYDYFRFAAISRSTRT